MRNYSYNLDAASICCLSLRRDMNLRRKSVGRSCKQNSSLSYKDVRSSQKKKRQPFKCRKSIVHSVKNLPETPEKYRIKPWLDDPHALKASHMTPVTSTPIPRNLKQIVPCEVQLRKLRTSNKHESGQVSTSEEKLVNRKISQMSLIIPFDSVNVTTRSSRSSIILQSQHSSKKTPNNAQMPISEKSKCVRKFSVSSLKQMCSVQKTKPMRKSSIPQKQTHIKHKKKSTKKASTTFQKQVFPVTSTPILVTSVSKCESNEISRIEKNVVVSKISEALESSNVTTRLSSRHGMTLRSQHSSKRTPNNIQTLAVEKVKPTRKSSTILQNQTPIVIRTVTLQKQTSKRDRKSSVTSQKKTTRQSQKSSVYSQKEVSSKCDMKSSGNCQKQISSKLGQKILAAPQEQIFLKCGRKSSAASGKRIRAKCKSFSGNIPVDDLALSVQPFQARKVKSDNFRLPGKNTLKRKRNAINALKMADDGYEDDIYESQKFEKFKELLMDTSESDRSYAMSTPKLGFQVTPLIRHKTPVFKDCFNPTEFAISRKVAEECIYRNKKIKSASTPKTPVVNEKRRLEFSQVLSDAWKVQKTVEKLTENESDDDNSYFSSC